MASKIRNKFTARRVYAVAAAVFVGIALSSCTPSTSGPPSSTSPTTAPQTTTTVPSPTTTLPTSGIGGDYNLTLGTPGVVTVHSSPSGTYTVSVKSSSLKLPGASCNLPVGTVLETFSGPSPSFSGTYSTFNPSTCVVSSWAYMTASLQSNGSIADTSYSSPHTLTRTAVGAVSSAPLGGAYNVQYGTAGSVTVHPSAGGQYSVSVKSTGLKLPGATCNLPVDTVLDTFTGTGAHLTGTYSIFDPTTCVVASWGYENVYLNSDGTFTVVRPGAQGFLAVNTAPAKVATAPVGGDYGVAFGTAGTVTVHSTTTGQYSVSVKSAALKMVGASCNLPVGTVVEVFSGTGANLTGTYSIFDPTTCAVSSWGYENVYVNSDGTFMALQPGSEGFLFTNTAAPVTSSTPVEGNYNVVVGSVGKVAVASSAGTYTASVTSGYKPVVGATCSLATGTIVDTFSGKSPAFTGTFSTFSPTTCANASWGYESVYVNTDGTLTVVRPGSEGFLYSKA